MPKPDRYRVAPNTTLKLADIPPDDGGGLDRAKGRAKQAALVKRLGELQELLYAQGEHALLVVLQAMDTGGKDSTIEAVFEGVNPQGCVVTSFKAPSEEERRHDFLWRVHDHAPERGYIGVFNRSHYEDVLIVRVKGLVPEKLWRKRYDHINAWEKMLHDEGTSILKFYLHISKDYQKRRLERRLRKPEKHWKFNPDDLAERERWEEYIRAYEEALSRCSTGYAPWYVIPAEHRWYRDLLVTQAIVDKLESLDMKYPEATFDPAKIVVK